MRWLRFAAPSRCRWQSLREHEGHALMAVLAAGGHGTSGDLYVWASQS